MSWRPECWDTSEIRENNSSRFSAEDVDGWIEAGADAMFMAVVSWMKSCQTLSDAFHSPEAGGEIFAIDWEEWQEFIK